MDTQENEILTRTGPGTSMGNVFRRFWIPALLSEEIPNPDCPPVRVKLLGEEFIAFRDTDGNVGLLDSRCPHRRAELFFGRNEAGGIRCAYHGWKFSVQGDCLDMPSEPTGSKLKEKVRVRSYPVAERGGKVWTYLGPKDLQPALPDVEYFHLPGRHVYASKCLMRCNQLQALEGSIDTAHLSFLHRRLEDSADENDVLGLGVSFKFSDTDSMPKFFVSETEYGLRVAARREAAEDHYYWRISQWIMPHTVFVATAPNSICRGNIFVPIDDENCWWYRVRWHPSRAFSLDDIRGFHTYGDYAELIPGSYLPRGNKENEYLINRAEQRDVSFSGIKSAQLQDIAVQESQGGIADRTKEFLGTTDAAIIRCRRALLDAAADLEKGIEPAVSKKPEAYRIKAPAMLLKRDVPLEEGIRDLVTADVNS